MGERESIYVSPCVKERQKGQVGGGGGGGGGWGWVRSEDWTDHLSRTKCNRFN